LNQEILQTEGIVLKAIPFRDHDQMITLFTPDAGLVKVIHKENRRALCRPLTRVELLYKEKRGEIFSSYGIHVIDTFPVLRQELSYIESSCDFIHAILESQCIGKAAPLLYQLFCSYLKKISDVTDPWVLAASFRLKLLRHEGIASFPFVCAVCHEVCIDSAYVFASEVWCKKDKPQHAMLWEREELESCYIFANCQQFHEIRNETVSKETLRKVSLFFDACLSV
jgi:DNA repair protein RecO (recombination protein O)